MFALLRGELSIVTGAESGLLISPLKRGGEVVVVVVGMNLISRREEKEKMKKKGEETKRSS